MGSPGSRPQWVEAPEFWQAWARVGAAGLLPSPSSAPPSRPPPPSRLQAAPFSACHTAVLPTSLPDYLSSGFLEQMFPVPSCMENKQALCCHLLSGGKSLHCRRGFLRGRGCLGSLCWQLLASNVAPGGWRGSSALGGACGPFRNRGQGSRL